MIVTHHHVDHAGAAERLRADAGATVFVHEADAPKVTGRQRSHVPSGFYRQSWRPSMMRYLAHSARVGGARYRPVQRVETLVDERELDLPGQPRVVPTPGHTAGHCAVVLEGRGVLLAGDALINFDYASGQAGLKLHRFNENRGRAHAALEQLERFDLPVVLFGHGDPWTQGSRKAIERARDAFAR